jgi:integrase
VISTPSSLGEPVLASTAGVVRCAERRTQMKRTGTKKAVPGVTYLRANQYLLRVQEIDEKTGRMIDVRRRVHCESFQEAVIERAKLLAEVREAGSRAQPKRVRVRDYARSWLSGRLPTLKASTAARYADTLDRHVLPVLGDIYLNALAAQDVLAWFQSKAGSRKPSTVNGYLRVLKVMVADAVVQFGLPINPTARIRSVPERGEEELESDDPVNLLTAEEMARFMEALKTRWPQWYAMIFTQFVTASRFSEVSALRWEDIDWEGGRIWIRRGNWRTIVSTAKIDRRRRTVALIEELRGELVAWRQRLVETQQRQLASGWVFPSQVGKPHHNSSCYRKAFVDCLQVVGLDRRFSSHGLRRTANDLIRRVASGEVARAITGHVTTRMTEHYSHVDAGEKDAAVTGMLRLVRHVEPNDRQEGEGSAKSTRRNGSAGNEIGTSLGTSVGNRHFEDPAIKKGGQNL